MRVLFCCYQHQCDNFLMPHIQELIKRGCDVKIFILDGSLPRVISRRGLSDIAFGVKSQLALMKVFKPDLIVTITPKAGLICLIVRLLSIKSISTRHVHWFTGQVWSTSKGLIRFIKMLPDVLLDFFSTYIFLDSFAQKEYLAKSKLFRLRNVFVPNKGSICGVEDALIDLAQPKSSSHRPLKIGIVGRVCFDKGLNDLIDSLPKIDSDVEFHFYGDLEETNLDLRNKFLKLVNCNESNWHYHGHVLDKKSIYEFIDVLLMASYREGFSNVLIEAQAFYVPIVSRKIYGVSGTFLPDVTGYFFESERQLALCLDLLQSDTLRKKFGIEGHIFVDSNFRRTDVVKVICDEYLKICES